jgi:acetylornithine deacetylase/succinyl-diaminopimelate desuccinylase-like protein
VEKKKAIERAEHFFDSGSFFTLLADWVAVDTGGLMDRSQMLRYLEGKITPFLEGMDFDCRVVENPVEPSAPFLIGRRIECDSLPSILIYGHGDTVPLMEGGWQEGFFPLVLTGKGKSWYGRGSADNKGQHAINLVALDCVVREREKLGFNVIVLIETGEERGSPGLHEMCEREKEFLKADLLIASDGPRIDPDVITLFGGSRAVFNFDCTVTLRQGGHHSGNWGGLLANPGIILSHALASMVDKNGKILVDGLRPENVPSSIRKAIDKLTVRGEDGPKIDSWWGEPGLSAAMKVYGWNSLEVLAFTCGDPDKPVNAIPPSAWARCHIRFTADSDPKTFLSVIRAHLDRYGFSIVEINEVPNNYGRATRMEPDNPFVRFVTESVERNLGKEVVFLPNLGGTLPNDVFADILGLPTLWVPHSYGGCNQHAVNEHVLESITREGLQLMAGIFQDLTEEKTIFCP